MNTVKKIICKVLIFLFIGTIIIISVGPLLWVLFSSFKTNKEILSGSLGLPAAFNFDNYADALKIAPIPQFYLNSIIVAVAATVLNVFLLSMAAYVIARFQWKGKTFFRLLFSVGLLIPGAALLQPLYQTMIAMGLYDSLIGLILVYIAFGLPTTIYVIRVRASRQAATAQRRPCSTPARARRRCRPQGPWHRIPAGYSLSRYRGRGRAACGSAHRASWPTCASPRRPWRHRNPEGPSSSCRRSPGSQGLPPS